MSESVKLISLEYNNTTYTADLKQTESGMLDASSGFETPVTASLFTWGRSPNANVSEQGQRFGWWGDSYTTKPPIGSLIWTLRRAKNSPETRRRLRSMCRDALAWMVADGIAKSITVEAERYALQAISLKISILRADGGRWAGIWRVHLDRL